MDQLKYKQTQQQGRKKKGGPEEAEVAVSLPRPSSRSHPPLHHPRRDSRHSRLAPSWQDLRESKAVDMGRNQRGEGKGGEQKCNPRPARPCEPVREGSSLSFLGAGRSRWPSKGAELPFLSAPSPPPATPPDPGRSPSD